MDMLVAALLTKLVAQSMLRRSFASPKVHPCTAFRSTRPGIAAPGNLQGIADPASWDSRWV